MADPTAPHGDPTAPPPCSCSGCQPQIGRGWGAPPRTPPPGSAPLPQRAALLRRHPAPAAPLPPHPAARSSPPRAWAQSPAAAASRLGGMARRSGGRRAPSTRGGAGLVGRAGRQVRGGLEVRERRGQGGRAGCSTQGASPSEAPPSPGAAVAICSMSCAALGAPPSPAAAAAAPAAPSAWLPATEAGSSAKAWAGACRWVTAALGRSSTPDQPHPRWNARRRGSQGSSWREGQRVVGGGRGWVQGRWAGAQPAAEQGLRGITASRASAAQGSTCSPAAQAHARTCIECTALAGMAVWLTRPGTAVSA